MKTIFLSVLLVICLSITSWAGEVTLTWDANTEADLAGYYLYRAERVGDHSTAWEKVATLQKGDTTYKDEIGEKNYAWILTAFDLADNESFPSNMVERYDRTPPITLKNLRKVKE